MLKKRKEEVDIKNNAENLVFQCESTLQELGDKVSGDDKSDVESKLAALKDAISGNNTSDIKAKSDELQQALYALSSKLYQQNGGAPNMGGAADMGGNTSNGGDDDVIDADYTEV